MSEHISIANSVTDVYRFAWLITPGEQPVPNVRIAVLNGTIAEIGDVPPDERSLIQPLALLPRFVNAHTHLEFSKLDEPIAPANPFPDWIRSVIRYRMAHPESGFVSSAIQTGVVECRRESVALAGEITTSNEGRQAIEAATADGHLTAAVSFRELIGFRQDAIDAQLAIAEASVAISAKATTNRVCSGLSPHAPYSVHPELFESVVDLAIKHEIPVAMHLAETLDEVELLSDRTGRFFEFLTSMNLWADDTLGRMTSVLPYLQKLAQAKKSLAVHCNYLSDAEIAFAAKHPNVAVVYCPRTHAYFGHSPHPWRKLMNAGATVVLGTDSKASNPDLSIWKELQFICRQPSVPPIWELLPLITTTAANALGFPADTCRIQTGLPLAGTTIACKCDSFSQLNATLLSPLAEISSVPSHGLRPCS